MTERDFTQNGHGLHASTKVDMFELGWFGQSDAFWKWVDTAEALPYIREVAAMHTALPEGTPLGFLKAFPEVDAGAGLGVVYEEDLEEDLEEEDVLDPDHLKALVERIEREFGGNKP